MRFVWFWNFWHWSKESFRSGLLLRGPLQGVGSHWDEWFRHEASEKDLQAIEETGRSEFAQRKFVRWLFCHWVEEAGFGGNPLVLRFVLGQIAHLPPFHQWPAFKKYRSGYGLCGISAVVLEGESQGESGDVRSIEALVLPTDDVAVPTVMSEGFHADSADLNTPRRAAVSMLSGKGLLVLLGLWIAVGCRPYAYWLKIALRLGWLAVGGLILFLLIGPESAQYLVPSAAALVVLWAGLVLISLTIVAGQSFQTWRQGHTLAGKLEQSQVRLRMKGGLTLKGGSAGLPFCLNILLALHRSYPRKLRPSGIWRNFFGKLHSEANSWAATGVVTTDARIRPVVLAPKLRACLQHGSVTDILIPHQSEAGLKTTDFLAPAVRQANPENARAKALLPEPRLGFAAEKKRLHCHRCLHVAQAMMTVGGLISGWQMAVNVAAVFISIIMLLAYPDLRGILSPPPAPIVVPPASTSPYDLWVSLDTKHPDYFQVVLESGFWSNRRAEVAPHDGANPSVRAEIRLRRLARPSVPNEEDGIVWIERRRRFLSREFAPGERVGRYSFSYLTRLGHE